MNTIVLFKKTIFKSLLGILPFTLCFSPFTLFAQSWPPRGCSAMDLPHKLRGKLQILHI